MHLLYNGQIYQEEEFIISLSNRAFQFGDGFFETIILEKERIRFWPEHLCRIKEAAAILAFDLKSIEELLPSLPKQLIHLAESNNCSEFARIKLKVWRSGEGLYTPQTDTIDWLATASPASLPTDDPLQIGLCETIRTIPSPFSSFKGINAPVYVLASREKVSRKVDDLMLLDPLGNVAELTSSNIFWAHKKTLFTPALESGCLNGITRRRILAWARESKWEVKEGLYPPESLLQSDLVFAGNVTGLKAISQLENEKLPVKQGLLSALRTEIFSL